MITKQEAILRVAPAQYRRHFRTHEVHGSSNQTLFAASKDLSIQVRPTCTSTTETGTRTGLLRGSKATNPVNVMTDCDRHILLTSLPSTRSTANPNGTQSVDGRLASRRHTAVNTANRIELASNSVEC